MSLKPIVNDAEALNDKALNLFCNSLTANEITGEGTIDLKNIECETLVCTNSADIRGSIFPDASTSSPSFILMDVLGNGNLTYENPAENNRIQNNTYISQIGNLTGGVNLNETSPPSFLKVGDTVIISGTFRCDVTSKTLTVDLQVVPFTSNNNTSISCKCSGNSARAGGGCLTEFDVTVSGNVITMYCYSVNDATINPVNMTNTVFHYTIQYRNN
jgi:hypothetical protein